MADDNSEPDGMKVLRLYVDAAGESRFETATIPLALKEFAPPAAPLRVSDPQPAHRACPLDGYLSAFQIRSPNFAFVRQAYILVD